MFPKINPSGTEAWNKLAVHAGKMKQVHMKTLFAEDGDRFKKYSFTLNDIVVASEFPIMFCHDAHR